MIALYRSGLLRIAGFAPLRNLVTRHGWRLGVGRFVSGEQADDAIRAIHELERSGLLSILDLLGEFVTTRPGAEAMAGSIIDTLDRLAGEPVDRYMSVKPTQLGLGLAGDGPAVALAGARLIAQRAASVDGRICLDMEDSPHVDGTLQLVRSLHGEGFRNVSTVLQSYLHRSPADLAGLLALDPPPPLRIVKGAYLEPPEVAMRGKRMVDEAFVDLTFTALEAGDHGDVATHDEAIIRRVEAFVRGARLGRDRYEFQMLYGVRPDLQVSLARSGHPVRVYVPFGSEWYGYYSRRLAERPANLWFLIRNLVFPSGRKEGRHV